MDWHLSEGPLPRAPCLVPCEVGSRLTPILEGCLEAGRMEKNKTINKYYNKYCIHIRKLFCQKKKSCFKTICILLAFLNRYTQVW